jgi:acyl-CoA thioesterase I
MYSSMPAQTCHIGQASGGKMAGLAWLAKCAFGRALVAFGFVALVLTSGGASAKPRSWRIIAFGDSLSAGFQLPASAAFPNVLEKALRARGFNAQVVNAAVSGDTVAGGVERIDWALSEGADIVILELGANDMLRGHDVERAMAGLDTLLTTVRARGGRALLAGMRASPSLGADYAARFDAIYPALAQKHGVPLYPFFLEGVAGDPALNKPDGLHPTKRGVEVIVERILPMVESMLKE